jgi:hypothetical protein
MTATDTSFKKGILKLMVKQDNYCSKLLGEYKIKTLFPVVKTIYVRYKINANPIHNKSVPNLN